MSVYGLIGAGVGLLVAVLGNLFVFPFVMKMRRERFGDRPTSLSPEQSQRRKALIEYAFMFQYRVVMPILFSVFGYIFGNQLLGAK